MQDQKSVRRHVGGLAFVACVLAASVLSGEQQGATFQARTAILLTPTFFPSPVEISLLESGQVYFEAFRTSTNQNGLYFTGGPGGFQTIMETGDAAPELPGLTMAGPSGEWVGVDGSYAFGVGLQGTGVTSENDYALYAGSLGSGPRLVFREGDPVPGLPGSFFDFAATDIRINRLGHVFFKVGLDSSPTSHALVVDVGGTQTVVTPISNTGSTNLAASPLGNVAFLGFLPGDDRFRVWQGAPGSIQAQLSVGGSAPGTVGSISELDGVAIISGVRSAVAASLSTGQNAIFSDVGGSPRLVQESALLLSSLTTDSYGHVAFLAGVGANQTLFSEQGTANLVILAEVGDQAPGMAPGVEFFALGSPIQNDFDQVAFAATLDGPGVGSSNDSSLWIFDPTLGLVAVAREGETIQIGPADTRTLQGFAPGVQSSLQDGAQKSFSQRGDIVFQAFFTDGDSAFLVASRPSAEIVFLDGFESGDVGAW